jgi:hypothetical protein
MVIQRLVVVQKLLLFDLSVLHDVPMQYQILHLMNYYHQMKMI